MSRPQNPNYDPGLYTDRAILQVAGLRSEGLNQMLISAATGISHSRLSRICKYLDGKGPKPFFKYCCSAALDIDDSKTPPPAVSKKYTRCPGCGGMVSSARPCYLCHLRTLGPQSGDIEYAA